MLEDEGLCSDSIQIGRGRRVCSEEAHAVGSHRIQSYENDVRVIRSSGRHRRRGEERESYQEQAGPMLSRHGKSLPEDVRLEAMRKPPG